MATVELKCANCGAALKPKGNYYACEYCGSLIFQLIEEGGFTEISLSIEQFREKLKQSGRIFTVESAQIKTDDADKKILRAKTQLARRCLEQGSFYEAEEILKDLPSDDFAVERLRFLAAAAVADETELAFYAGDITALPHFKTAIDLCDEKTRETYCDIAKICLDNARINEQTAKGRKLNALDVKEGLKYAENLVKNYPFHARAWECLIEARCLRDEKYNPFGDLEFFNSCPDARIGITGGETDYYGAPEGISSVIAERCRRINGKKMAKWQFWYKYAIKPLLVVAGLGVALGLWALINFLTS